MKERVSIKWSKVLIKGSICDKWNIPVGDAIKMKVFLCTIYVE